MSDPADPSVNQIRPAADLQGAAGGPAGLAWPAQTLVIGVSLALLAAYLARWVTIGAREIHATDFMTFRDAALVLREFGGGREYDPALHAQVHLAAGGAPAVGIVYANPPVAALIVAPLAWLDAVRGYFAWTTAQLVLVAAAAVIAWRASAAKLGTTTVLMILLLSLASPAVYGMLIQGQWQGIPALGLAVAYMVWTRGNAASGGVILAFCIASTKPHLGVGLAAWALGWRNRHALLGLAAGVATSIAAGLLVGGIGGIASWLGAVSTLNHDLPWTFYVGLPSAIGLWIPGMAGIVVASIGSCVMVVAAYVLGVAFREGRASLEPSLAGATIASLALAPHLFLHDLAIFVPVVVFVCAWAATRPGGRPAMLTVCIGLTLAVWTGGALDATGAMPAAVGHPTGVLLALAVVVAVAQMKRLGTLQR